MLNKLCKILFFIKLLLMTGQSYAVPPTLPPSLPDVEVATTEDKEFRYNSDTSIFDKFKQFFSKPQKKYISPKSTNEQTKTADQEEPKLSQEPNENEHADSFMDISNVVLPSAASNNDVYTNTNHESSVNLASYDNIPDIQVMQQEPSESEIAETFIDIGSTKLPSATSDEMRDAEIAANVHDENLASNIITRNNIPRPMVSIPLARPGSYVVPPSPPVQIYKPTNLLAVHKKHILLNPPPDVHKTQESIIPIAPPATSSIPNMPAISLPAVSTPVTQDTNPSTIPAIVPLVGTPVVPSNVPVPLAMPTDQPSTQPIMPSSTNTAISTTPIVVPDTNFSADINNSQETLTASSNIPKKQDWNTPLIPVVVVNPNQSKSSEMQVKNSQTTNNQEKSLPVSSPNVMMQEQYNNINNETLESATKFVKDETQMLLLPDDDIVLGKLTEQATLEQMDMYAYIRLFQKKEEWIVNAERRKVVESFIKYDNDINKKKDIYANLSYYGAVDNAFRAVDRNNLFGLRALLDVYPILQEKSRLGETLLTAATYNDNYYLAKFLVIRGIKISTLNYKCQYPLDIALVQGNSNIACILIKAKGYN
ncbi:threonyl-tRNA synthetase [Rickettsia canadensis str. McKiel]|uniref:Threonyl-tRNA synthetase n=1 Tax=Rickettsia canadensis (strain McKiel) TaxID=293613 RepID=A8EXX4_RICCK|nr:hypothetical protein [Rickettsia canadensis]ABV73207.1 threonyl-tRNA synthetase [Rickettsia canadensis str. McKiel]